MAETRGVRPAAGVVEFGCLSRPDASERTDDDLIENGMNSARIREIGIAYDDAGSGPALVMLHGYPFDRSMWREQIS